MKTTARPTHAASFLPSSSKERALVASSVEALLQQRLEQEGLGEEENWRGYFARHSRSFSFAALLFPPAQRQQVAGVYAFSRFTDDLVDGEHGWSEAQRRDVLALWQELAARAYHGETTGIFLLDRVMGDMARHGAPFSHANELMEGVRMDLERRRYPDHQTLCLYAYRVASTVGLWLSELFGTHDRWMLERAAALGEAMQITNILRDVGEDLGRDRIYLPQDRMAAHGVTDDDLRAFCDGAPIPDNYAALIEELLDEAERRYDEAFAAIPGLPRFFQRPVAVAALVYRGIHEGIRRNGYDNLRRRARTSLWQKLRLAWRALRRLRRERAVFVRGARPPRATLTVFAAGRDEERTS